MLRRDGHAKPHRLRFMFRMARSTAAWVAFRWDPLNTPRIALDPAAALPACAMASGQPS
jgi:hypothetical protein